MAWTYHFHNQDAMQAMGILDGRHKADLKHFQDLIAEFGLQGLNTEQSKPLGDGLFEFRLRGVDTIARVFYTTKSGYRIVFLHAIIKKTNKTPAGALEIARQRCTEVKAEEATEKRVQANTAKMGRKGKKR